MGRGSGWWADGGEYQRVVSNPRTLFDQAGDAGLQELAASIQAQGLLQPITVRPNPSGHPPFLLIAGERRLRAVRDSLARPSITCLVRHDLDARAALEGTVLENLQRRDLHPVEEARGLSVIFRALWVTGTLDDTCRPACAAVVPG